MQSEPAVERMSRDIAQSAKLMGADEARFLVTQYYVIQEDRKRSMNQLRRLEETQAPNSVLTWFATQSSIVEKQIQRALDVYSDNHPLGMWARRQIGIGPVIASGLLAHINFDKVTTVSSIWRYAGLDPTIEWLGREGAKEVIHEAMEAETVLLNEHLATIASMTNRKLESLVALATNDSGNLSKTVLAANLAKRPWNASLKVLCWKIGESFMKLVNHEECYYGKILLERWEYEKKNNEAKKYADQAKEILEEKRISVETEAYKSYTIGRLPPAHILARAKRYAVKMFLSDYYAKGCQILHRPATIPYPIAHMGHTHYRIPPE